MFKYTLKPYLRSRQGKFGGMPWGFVSQLMHDAGMDRGNYTLHTALSYYSDVTFYSKKKLTHVPAKNGILLPVRFYDEEQTDA